MERDGQSLAVGMRDSIRHWLRGEEGTAPAATAATAASQDTRSHRPRPGDADGEAGCSRSLRAIARAYR